MSTKGLEYDATVIVDPAEITAESPGGVRVLYVALTRAAHRMTVLELER
jgi:Superfamily I DNA and RNA helicases